MCKSYARELLPMYLNPTVVCVCYSVTETSSKLWLGLRGWTNRRMTERQLFDEQTELVMRDFEGETLIGRSFPMKTKLCEKFFTSCSVYRGLKRWPYNYFNYYLSSSFSSGRKYDVKLFAVSSEILICFFFGPTKWTVSDEIGKDDFVTDTIYFA